MKKIILSTLLILGFGTYVFYRHDKDHYVATAFTLSVQSSKPSDHYQDGQYTGKVSEAYYGSVQVAAVISGGKITDVAFLDYPHERQNSVRLNEDAMPRLRSEALAIQSPNVDSITGASLTSAAFLESFSSALDQAKL